MPDAKDRRAAKRHRGTGHPSEKDRSHHEASRGTKMQTLADLSRRLPGEDELKHIFQTLETESDRGVALIAGSLLENTLAMTLSCHFAHISSAFQKSLFEGSDAPLSTFSGKIRLGRALAIYDGDIQKRIETVKDIRNAFAHSLHALYFTHPTIVASVRRLAPYPLFKNGEGVAPARIRYATFCYSLGKRLHEVASDVGGRDMRMQITAQNWQPQ